MAVLPPEVESRLMRQMGSLLHEIVSVKTKDGRVITGVLLGCDPRSMNICLENAKVEDTGINIPKLFLSGSIIVELWIPYWHVIIAEFPTEEDAEQAYKAVIEFVSEERYYYHSILEEFGSTVISNIKFNSREEAERWRRTIMDFASRMGKEDRVKCCIRRVNSEIIMDIDFDVWLINVGKTSPDNIRRSGRAVSIHLSTADDGKNKLVDTLVNMLKNMGGNVLSYTLRVRIK